jgi:proline iminopeptidase
MDTTACWVESWKEAQEIVATKGSAEQKRVFRDIFEGRVRTIEESNAWFEVMNPLYYYKYDRKIAEEQGKRVRHAPLVAAHMWRNVLPTYDVRGRLWTITFPTLVIVGRHDWITPVSQAKDMARLIRGSRLEIFEESGHTTYMEENEKFLKVVGDFLSVVSTAKQPYDDE